MLKEQIEAIDSEIRRIPPSVNGFEAVRDGIVDPDKYMKCNKRILWVLKEVNGSGDTDQGGWDMRHALKENLKEGYVKADWKRTFSSIVYVTYGIIHNKSWNDTIDQFPGNAGVVHEIAFINVKKIPGKARSYKKELRDNYEKYKDLLFRQIDAIDPDIIIFGGTFFLFENDIKVDSKTDFGTCTLYQATNKIFIKAYHPQNRRISREKYFEDIIQAVRGC